MQTVLVTGGAGFIGSNLVEQLLKQEYRVVCVDNFDDTYDPTFKRQHIAPFETDKNFKLYQEDIRDLDKMRSIFADEKPELVAHLAAKADTRDAVKNPRIYVSVNIDGTLNILELCQEFGVKQTALASSGSVYGNNPNTPWVENENTDFALSAYGATKKFTEMLAYSYHHNYGMNVLCLRYFNVYGENNRPNMVPYKWAKAILEGVELEISGEGTRKRDFTYVKDVVQATILALQSDLHYEIINIANSQPVSLKELLDVFQKVTGIDAKVKTRESHHASVNEMYANSKKAQDLLNWQPLVNIEEGIANLVEWYKKNRLVK